MFVCVRKSPLFNCPPFIQVIDVINEEEKMFLKTLTRGKRVFERTVQRLGPDASVIPGIYADDILACTHLSMGNYFMPHMHACVRQTDDKNMSPIASQCISAISFLLYYVTTDVIVCFQARVQSS